MRNGGLIMRLEKGKCILTETWEELDIYEIVPEINKPSYIGFWSALHYHKMTVRFRERFSWPRPRGRNR
jgi:predicted transcriptional regulator of viral defense system